MAHAEMVERAFRRTRKAAHPAEGAQGVELLLPAGKQLVGVGLMAHVPDQLVSAGVEHGQQRQGELHDAERWGEMPAVHGDRADDDLPDLLGKGGPFVGGQARHVVGVADPGQYAQRRVRKYGHQFLSLSVEDARVPGVSRLAASCRLTRRDSPLLAMDALRTEPVLGRGMLGRMPHDEQRHGRDGFRHAK
ncbi:hypothetical protein DSECCO2_654330 [anaerobic digester metagenome]